MSLYFVLNIITTASGTLPIIAALYNYKHLDKVLKIMAVFFLVSALFDWGLEIAVFLGISNDLPAIHLFIVVSTVFWGIIYYHAFFNPGIKKAVGIVSAIALVAVLFNSILLEGIWTYPSISNTILSVQMILFSLAYFYQLLSRQEFIHIEKQSLFWINAGVLIYFSIDIFLFMLLRKIIENHQEKEYYMIHIITNIIANILFTIGLLCKPQKTT